MLAAGEQLVAAGIEAVAICLINSYRNPVHEQRIEALLRERFPALLVTASYQVLPERKEYERTSTTVVNAYLLSAMRSYLRNLDAGLRKAGVVAPIRVMTSNGGMLAAQTASDKPVFVVASGPAGGVIGGARLGMARGDPDLIVFDMGGTTAKAVIIEDGRPSMTSEYEFRDGLSFDVGERRLDNDDGLGVLARHGSESRLDIFRPVDTDRLQGDLRTLRDTLEVPDRGHRRDVLAVPQSREAREIRE